MDSCQRKDDTARLHSCLLPFCECSIYIIYSNIYIQSYYPSKFHMHMHFLPPYAIYSSLSRISCDSLYMLTIILKKSIEHWFQSNKISCRHEILLIEDTYFRRIRSYTVTRFVVRDDYYDPHEINRTLVSIDQDFMST